MYSSRHKARELALKELYSEDFCSNVKNNTNTSELFSFLTEDEKKQYDNALLMYSSFLVNSVKENFDDINAKILTYSRGRDLKNIDKIDLAILRLSIASILFDKETHPSVVIDEAIKLSMEYSGNVSFRFVNGVLDAFVKERQEKK